MFAYLRQNAKKIIAEKKAFPTITDDLSFGYAVKEDQKKHEIKTKALAAGEEYNPKEVDVEVIANMSGWCDSQMDVMIKDNWNRSIGDLGASGQRLFYHMKNHGTGYQYTTDAIIGRDPELFVKDVPISQFNIKSDVKKAQALMMTSTVCECYDQKCFYLYRDGQIKQHSIGLQYVKIYLCMDSEEPEDSQYKENWDKFYPGVINKDKVDTKGFFWAVLEAKILEVSAVPFGSNELTPVTEVGDVQDDAGSAGKSGADDQPIVHEEPAFDIKEAIKSIKFFN